MWRKTWIIFVVVAAFGALAGVMIAGRPTTADKRHIAAPESTSSSLDASSTDPSTSTSTSVAPVSGSTSTAASTTEPSSTVAASTEVAPPTTPSKSAVRVAVANGAKRQGLASKVAKALNDAGWTTAQATDAKRSASTSVVYFQAGFESAAAMVLADLGQELSVEALPASGVSGADAQADVVVLLGSNYPG